MSETARMLLTLERQQQHQSIPTPTQAPAKEGTQATSVTEETMLATGRMPPTCSNDPCNNTSEKTDGAYSTVASNSIEEGQLQQGCQ
jgi:hypothetical protein